MKDLKELAKEVRKNTLSCVVSDGMGHVGGCLSATEVLTALYFKHMQGRDPKNPKKEDRDRLVCSKGHAGPVLYAILAMQGYFPMEELNTLNQPHTRLPSHCDMNKTPGIDMTAGSLGQGLSCAIGIALASKLKGDGARVYAILGDGESQEGEVWEAAMFAGNRPLDNLIAFLDYNKCQVDGTIEEICDIAPVDKKWEAFKWNVITVADGNDIDQVDAAIEEAKKHKGGPTMVILNTVKGKGVSFIEALGAANHHINFSADDLKKAVEEIDGGKTASVDPAKKFENI